MKLLERKGMQRMAVADLKGRGRDAWQTMSEQIMNAVDVYSLDNDFKGRSGWAATAKRVWCRSSEGKVADRAFPRVQNGLSQSTRTHSLTCVHR